MIDIYELYKDFASRVNTWQGGNFRFESDFVRNVNTIYYDIWEREAKNARKSQESKDNMIAFHVSKNIAIKPNIFERYCKPVLPVNYGRFSSARIILQKIDDKNLLTVPDVNVDKGKCYTGNTVVKIDLPSKKSASVSEIPIELIDDAQWAGCMQHLKKYPSISAPKMIQIDGTFQIAPKEISVILFSYYTMPEPAFASVTYTDGDDQNGNGDEVVYNKQKSKQILFPLNLKNEFLWRLGEIYGYFTREQFLSMFGNEKTKK